MCKCVRTLVANIAVLPLAALPIRISAFLDLFSQVRYIHSKQTVPSSVVYRSKFHCFGSEETNTQPNQHNISHCLPDVVSTKCTCTELELLDNRGADNPTSRAPRCFERDLSSESDKRTDLLD